jgi:hypothetical protein
MTAKRIARRRPAPSSGKGESPAFPVHKAFVLQFSRESRTQTGIFSGRVEHMSSGRRARFVSAEELVAFLAKTLDEVEGQPS